MRTTLFFTIFSIIASACTSFGIGNLIKGDERPNFIYEGASYSVSYLCECQAPVIDRSSIHNGRYQTQDLVDEIIPLQPGTLFFRFNCGSNSKPITKEIRVLKFPAPAIRIYGFTDSSQRPVKLCDYIGVAIDIDIGIDFHVPVTSFDVVIVRDKTTIFEQRIYGSVFSIELCRFVNDKSESGDTLKIFNTLGRLHNGKDIEALPLQVTL